MKKILVVLLMIMQCSAATAFSYTLGLTEQELQAKADQMMPLQKKKFFVTTTLTNPVIALLNSSNKISLSADVAVQAAGNINGSGSVTFNGALRYDNKSGSFYFDDLEITSLNIKQLSPAVLPKIKSSLQGVAQKVLATQPVYTFNDKNLKHQLAKSALKSILVKDQKLIIELGLF